MKTKLTKEDIATLDELGADFHTEIQQGTYTAWLVDRGTKLRYGHGRSGDELTAIQAAIADGKKAARPKSEKQRLSEFDKMEKELAEAKRKLAEIETNK